MGREFVGVGGSEPNSLAAEKLKNIYDSIENLYYNYVNFKCKTGWFRYFTGIDEDEEGVSHIDTYYIDNYLIQKIQNGDNIDVNLYDYGMYLKYIDELKDFLVTRSSKIDIGKSSCLSAVLCNNICGVL